MNRKSIEIQYEVFDDFQELPEAVQNLMNKAQEACEHAYAPYSGFRVGAAVLLESGEIVSGSNQENAAYPSGLCAERVAVFYCGSRYPDRPVSAIAITARALDYELAEPVGSCGACRQVMLEQENRQQTPIALYFMGETGKIIKIHSVKDLLPFRFDSSFGG